MRSLAYVFTLASLACWNTSPCLAQQPAGPRTLENLLNSDNAQKPAAAAEADATNAGPKRPAGTVARPADGVQHPDLDKAWAEYDAAVTKAAEGIQAAINKQFDAATTKGDLDAAEKWQAALEKFEKAGEVPAESETKAAVSSAASEYKKAREELSKAYETVVKALTMDKKIAEAKAARDEARILFNDVAAGGEKSPSGPKMAPHLQILEAKYGADRRWKDVTKEVQALVMNNDTLLVSCQGLNKVVGDPAFGVEKTLVVKYRFKGSGEKTAGNRENDRSVLVIHQPQESSSDRFSILGAYYGTGITWLDVTRQVKAASRPSGVFLQGYGDGVRAFGNDPAFGYSKRVVVRYLHQGKEMWKDFGDGEAIAVP
jgi:tetratricopeptide (TPR) repeat protein